MLASSHFFTAKPIQGKSHLSVSADFCFFITQEGHKLTYSCFVMFIPFGLLQAIDKLLLAKHSVSIKSWSLPADPDIGIRWTVSFYLQHVKGLVKKKKKTFLLLHS